MKNIVILTVYVIGQLNYSNEASPPLKKRFTEEDLCPISETTLEKVDSCPRNNVTIRERSETKNCQQYEPCKGDPLVYHCVRHENNLVEVCAPKEIITGHCCAVFFKTFGRVVADYNMPCPECPFNYQSNTALKYRTCTCHSYENGRSKSDAECNTKFEEATGKDPKVSSGNPMMGYIIVPIAVVMIFLGGGLFVFWMKRKQWANVNRTSFKFPYECVMIPWSSQSQKEKQMCVDPSEEAHLKEKAYGGDNGILNEVLEKSRGDDHGDDC